MGRRSYLAAGEPEGSALAHEPEEIVTDPLPDAPAPAEAAAPAIVVDLRSKAPVVELAPASFRQLRLFEEARLLRAPRWKLAVKRFIDILGAVVAIVLLSPIMIAAAIAVAVSSPGPVLFKQTRIGRNGVPFTFLKFRSMYQDAEERLEALRAVNEKLGPIFKIRNDMRMTRVGRVLRRCSVDELPQLFHVLAGQMTLVGPRPPLPNEVAQYDERSWGRLLAKPGITCTWQVSGRSDLDFDTWVSMDLEYIENWGLGLDFKLLLATVPAVLSGRGAY